MFSGFPLVYEFILEEFDETVNAPPIRAAIRIGPADRLSRSGAS
ncbi:MAG: hypothetical protein R3F54_32360 [Alphaproteobacteria bacterium]